MSSDLEWTTADAHDCENIMHLLKGARVIFVDGTFADRRSANQQEIKERMRSPCEKYVAWLFPTNSIKHPNEIVDLRIAHPKRKATVYDRSTIYFFKKPALGFFASAPRNLDGLHWFEEEDYDVYEVMAKGSQESVTMHAIALYYLKILPSSRKDNVYVHGAVISIPYHEMISQPAYISDIYTFLKSVPDAMIGITFVVQKDTESAHGTLLIFDKGERRLELYDPNGKDAVYGSHATPRYMYDSLLQNLHEFQNLDDGTNLVCKLWANAFEFQQEEGSCTLWASVIAICRMSGIPREKLPTRIQDLFEISSSIRGILWETCQFSKFPQGYLNLLEVDDVLRDCVVPSDDRDMLLDLVMNHNMKTPIPIPPDVDVCGESPREEANQPCDRVTVNVNEVDVHEGFIEYVDDICKDLRHVTVILPDVTTYTYALDKLSNLLSANGTLELQLPQPLDLNNDRTTERLKRLLDKDLKIKVRDGVVRQKDGLFLSPNLHFDSVLVEQPIFPKQMAELKSMSNTVVGVIEPLMPPIVQEVTINLLDPNITDIISHWTNTLTVPFGKHRIVRLICQGPLAGQEPLVSGWDISKKAPLWTKQFHELLDMSQSIEIPSMAGEYFRRQSGTRINIREFVFLLPNRMVIEYLTPLIDSGELRVKRWVFRFEPKSHLVETVNIMVQEELGLNNNIYFVLDPVTEETVRVTAEMNVRKYIIDEQYEHQKPAFLAELLSAAEDVIYRKLAAPTPLFFWT